MTQRQYRIGVDLGGTKLAAGVVDARGKIVGESVTYDHTGLAEKDVLDCMERNIDGAMLASGCADGNELCRAVVEDYARYIGIGMYNVFQILNPAGIVLGGGLLNLPAFFFDTAAATCYGLAGTMMYDRMTIRRGLLGGAAAVIGAAALFEA